MDEQHVEVQNLLDMSVQGIFQFATISWREFCDYFNSITASLWMYAYIGTMNLGWRNKESS